MRPPPLALAALLALAACTSLQADVARPDASDPCGGLCAPGRACVSGRCSDTVCVAGRADCDGASGNGCEVDLLTDAARCGACDSPCPAPAHGVASCAAGMCGAACDRGYERSTGACLPPGAPRLVAPLSASVVGARPTLRWALGAGADGARVTLCRDRAMTAMCRTLDAAGSSLRVPDALPSGRWFWRATDATWSFVVGPRGTPDAGAAAPLADLDGAGFDDVAVGAPRVSVAGASYVGAWSLFPGSARGLSAMPARVVTGVFAADNLGEAMAAGDFDGDGIADLAVGAPSGVDGEGARPGAVRVYRSGAGGAAGRGVRIQGAAPAYGARVVGVGDVNGDGFGDLAVRGGLRPGEPAVVSVFWGSEAGVGAAPAQVVRVAATRLAGAADLQRDGFADLLVGTASAAPGGRPDAGAVSVYAGSATGPGASPAQRIEGEAAGDLLGTSVAMLGDTDGDGFDDFAAGAPGARGGAGSARVYAGGPGAATLRRTLDGAAGEALGSCVARVGDVNGDGYADLAVGAVGALGGRGRVSLYLGGATGIGPAAARVWDGDAARDGVGELVVGVGDVNGDGYADVAVAARGASLGADAGVGRVRVYAGAPEGPAAAPTWVLDGVQVRGYFGSSIARVGGARRGRHRAG